MNTETIEPEVAGKNADIMQLSVLFEQKAGAGEDAEPINIVSGSSGLLAVFDGMGGAGGGTVKDREGCNRTAAYCASRLAREVVEGWFRETCESASAGPSMGADEI